MGVDPLYRKLRHKALALVKIDKLRTCLDIVANANKIQKTEHFTGQFVIFDLESALIFSVSVWGISTTSGSRVLPMPFRTPAAEPSSTFEESTRETRLGSRIGATLAIESASA